MKGKILLTDIQEANKLIKELREVRDWAIKGGYAWKKIAYDRNKILNMVLAAKKDGVITIKHDSKLDKIIRKNRRLYERNS